MAQRRGEVWPRWWADAQQDVGRRAGRLPHGWTGSCRLCAGAPTIDHLHCIPSKGTRELDGLESQMTRVAAAG